MMIKKLKKAAADTLSDSDMTLQATLNWLINGVDVENRRIEVRGEVCDALASHITRALLRLSEISHEPIELYLSSPGGDAYEGMAIFDAIVACPCDVHIIASGKIMSAGFVIFLAGDKRVAAKHTSFMMHSVSYSADGTAKDHEIQVNEGKRINNMFLDIMAQRTKKPKKFWYRKILPADCYMGVEEATALGIINAGELPRKPERKTKAKPVRKVTKRKARK